MPKKPNMKEEDKRKHTVSIRLNDKEKDFIERFCEENDMKPRSFLRSCAIDYGMRMMEDGNLMNALEPEDKRVAKEVIHHAFDSFKLDMLKTFEKMDERMLHLEKTLETFVYLTLVLTKDVPQDQKAGRIKEGKERFKKFEDMVKRRYTKVET
ncbi:MAG: hypothetical protein P9X22_08160 [Candidatus Zapsychrus exili]|nr:hypothetical protein [Candidatus Zapsychrus exili]